MRGLLAIFLSLPLLILSKKPHIVHVMIDDLGWAEVGYHNIAARAAGDIKTPVMDSLIKEGLELDRFYTEKICSPSRSSFQSGRFGTLKNSSTRRIFLWMR